MPEREINRRSLLAAAAAAGAAAAAPHGALAEVAGRTRSSAPAAARRFFTARELAILDEVAELIIPADAQSPGARAAKVAIYLDARVGEARDPTVRQSWRDDLAEIDRLARESFKRGFLEASPEQRTKLLERIAKNEANPKEAGEYAFGTIKWAVADTYYRTRIGIHDELGYQGNVLLAEFAGTDVTDR